MKHSREDRIVLMTAPSLAVARRVAKAVLEERLVACANIVRSVESHYWWDGRVQKGSEVLVIFKTRQSRLARLEKSVHAHHPYQVPEFVVLPILAGSAAYLKWIGDSLLPAPRD